MAPTKGRMAYTTTKTPAQTRREIYDALDHAGADQIAIGTNDGLAVAAFRFHDRHIRVSQPLPKEPSVARYSGRSKPGVQGFVANPWTAYDAEERRRWRMVFRIIEINIELILDEIIDVDDAFMPYILLPDSTVVRDHTRATIAEVYATGKMPNSMLPVPALPSGGPKAIGGKS